MDKIMKNKWLGTSYSSLFGLQNMFKKIPFVVIYHQGNFDELLHGGFWVIPKIAFANLSKSIHSLISQERKEFFRWNEKDIS